MNTSLMRIAALWNRTDNYSFATMIGSGDEANSIRQFDEAFEIEAPSEHHRHKAIRRQRGCPIVPFAPHSITKHIERAEEYLSRPRTVLEALDVTKYLSVLCVCVAILSSRLLVMFYFSASSFAFLFLAALSAR